MIADGAAFEKGGVNTSIVTGTRLPPSVVAQRPELEGHGFFAAGVSVVLHPQNPYAPTAHCNFRYFETHGARRTPSAWWFGGGCRSDAVLSGPRGRAPFSPRCAQRAIATTGSSIPPLKIGATAISTSRIAETRGVGGIFYDYLDGDGFGETNERTTFHSHDVRAAARVHVGCRRRVRRGVRAAGRTARARRLRRTRARVSVAAPRPLRRVQPALRPRHAFRLAERRPHRIDPDVAAAAGSLGLRRTAGARQPGSGTGATCSRATGLPRIRCAT